MAHRALEGRGHRSRHETRRIARNTERLTNSFTYYGLPTYNYIRLRSTATYNLQFFHFTTNDAALSAGAEAFAQVILCPAFSDMFVQATIKNYDSFVVSSIEWDYIPPATEALISEADKPVFPFANCVLRFVYDPTANVNNLKDVKADARRYMNNAARALEICKDTVKNSQYDTNESLAQQHSVIRRPSCTLVNETSPVGTQGRQRIETNSTPLYTGDANNLYSGWLAATYGTLSLVVPAYINGLVERNVEWPSFFASLSVTYHLDCYGQN